MEENVIMSISLQGHENEYIVTIRSFFDVSPSKQYVSNIFTLKSKYFLSS